MKLFFRAGVIILFTLLLAAGSLHAEIASISVIPTVNKIMLSKGEAKSGTYAVFNKSDKDLHIKIEPRYWHLNEENRDIPLNAWLKISPTEFDLLVGENRMQRVKADQEQGRCVEVFMHVQATRNKQSQ